MSEHKVNKLKVKATQLGFFGNPGRRVREGEIFVVSEEQYSPRWMEILEGKLLHKDKAEKKGLVAKAFNAVMGFANSDEKVAPELSDLEQFDKEQAAKNEGKLKDESGLPTQHGTLGGSSDTTEGAAKAAHDVL